MAEEEQAVTTVVAASTDEKRDANRIQQISYVELHGRHGMYRGMVVNVSQTGALLTIIDPGFTATVEDGDLGLVGLRVASLFGEGMNIRWREHSVHVGAEVVRLTEGSEGDRWTFSLGCRFLRELTPAECTALGFGADPISEPDRSSLAEAVEATAGETRDTPPSNRSSVFEPMLEGVERVEGTAHVSISKSGRQHSLHGLLESMVLADATDLHIQGGSRIRMRVDGELADVGGRSISADDAEAFVGELLTDTQFDEFVQKGDFDLAHSVEGIGRFRINVLLARGIMGMAIRHIPMTVPTANDLDLAPACTMLAERRTGLVLVTGATGSGKSTTLAAMVDHINTTRTAHIITMEDPIEYLHSEKLALITQREVGRDTESFASALKRALRQDPDVILVGELRDLETISLAVTAAETGHLVLGTLHTSSAVQSVDRIVDVFPSGQQQQIRMQLAASIEGVISQVLVPRIGGGVTVAQEILIATSAVRSLIREAKAPQLANVIQTNAREGMQTLDDSLNQLVTRGIISHGTAISHAHSPGHISAKGKLERRALPRA